MSPTAATEKPKPRKRAPTPGTLKKTPLTLAAAEEQWLKGDRLARQGKELKDEAAPVLLAHFEKTKAANYKRVAWKWAGGQTVWKTEELRAFLGRRVSEFQRQAKQSRSLFKLGE